MKWQFYIDKLQAGETVQLRPRGNSMKPKVLSGQLVTVEPYPKDKDPQVNDIVLCKVRGNVYLHLVTSVQADRYQIGNNQGHINGTCGRPQIFGRCTKVED